MSDLKDTATHITDLKGAVDVKTSDPTDTGVAGLATGQWYVNSTKKTFNIYTGTYWYGVRMTAA